MRALLRNEWTIFVVAMAASILTAVLTFARANAVLAFVISAIALGTLATVVGHATEQLGNYMGPGATGVVQAGIASMPELFVSFFALQAGLITVVQSALVGSILANSLLVMGLAFLFGGWKNGTQRFHSERPRAIVILMVLAVSALVVPTLAHTIHTPASAHEETLSIASALVLLVVVAIAGNAVENTVGIRLAVKNKVDYAISIVMNSSLQIALALTPILVLLSYFFAPVALTLVLPPLLVVSLALTAILSALIVYGGESNWLEGLALVGLYIMIAISFWWG